jgi:hypothetical protein
MKEPDHGGQDRYDASVFKYDQDRQLHEPYDHDQQSRGVAYSFDEGRKR